MTPRAFQSLVAALIRIGLLLALVIMLMAENAQAQPLLVPAAPTFSRAFPESAQTRVGDLTRLPSGPRAGRL